MDATILKNTQDTLGKIIRKPPLTEKLLTRPPFRFLHDIMTSVIRATGFMEGLFTEEEMNSDNVKDKESKMAFLQKVIDLVSMVIGKQLAVRTSKIVAGHEPEKTNLLLQGLAEAVNKQVDNTKYVRKVLGTGGDLEKEHGEGDKKRKTKDKGDNSKTMPDAENREELPGDKESERKPRERVKEGKHRRHHDDSKERLSDGAEKERSKHKSAERQKLSEQKLTDKDLKPKSKVDVKSGGTQVSSIPTKASTTKAQHNTSHGKARYSNKSNQNAPPDKAQNAGHRGMAAASAKLDVEKQSLKNDALLMPTNDLMNKKESSKWLEPSPDAVDNITIEKVRQEQSVNSETVQLNETETTGNDPELVHMDDEESKANATSTRVERPSSAKGSRRRRDGRTIPNSEELVARKLQEETEAEHMVMMDGDREEGDPPPVTQARTRLRPSSARPAPPRIKKPNPVTDDPSIRLGSGRPSNVITVADQSDDDEYFIVEDTKQPEPEQVKSNADFDDEEHGQLVKKIIETSKELEGGSTQGGPTKKVEIERSGLSDAARRKERELIQKEVEKLQECIQGLTRCANPLGKIMDYVQEDVDAMQMELQEWRDENKQLALQLRQEQGITNRSIEPLKAQLDNIDQAIQDQLGKIDAMKSNVFINDAKIDKILRSVTQS